MVSSLGLTHKVERTVNKYQHCTDVCVSSQMHFRISVLRI